MHDTLPSISRRPPRRQITTCHPYEIFYKYRYGCLNCGKEEGRHSKSMNTANARCKQCYFGKFELLGTFNRDGSRVEQRESNPFAIFVKQHFSELKGTPPH